MTIIVIWSPYTSLFTLKFVPHIEFDLLFHLRVNADAYRRVLKSADVIKNYYVIIT